VDNEAWEAFSKEYSSLRDESLQTSQLQQSIFQWSIGATALLFAGTMSVISGFSEVPSSLPLLMLGFGIPGFVVGSSLAWAGELVRKERVGFYLRIRERSLWPPEERKRTSIEPPDVADAARFPMVWENFISFSRAGIGEKRASFGYFGGVSIYFGATLISLLAFMQELVAHQFHAHDRALTRAGLSYAAVVIVIYLAFLMRFGWSLLQRSRRLATLQSEEVPREGAD